jgi:hypothetical protein
MKYRSNERKKVSSLARLTGTPSATQLKLATVLAGVSLALQRRYFCWAREENV